MRTSCAAPLGMLVSVLAGVGSLSGQSGSLGLSSSLAVRGGTASLNLTLASAGSAIPAALQWTLAYLPADVTAVSVVVGPASTAAGKELTCASKLGAYTCLVVGMNLNTIANGVVATATFTLAPTAASGISIGLTNSLGASPEGNGIPIGGLAGSITVSDPVLVNIKAVTCDATIATPGTGICSVSLTAPSTGAVTVLLSSGNPFLSVPVSVAVPAGALAAAFSATGALVSSDQTALVSAHLAGSTASATIQLRAPAPAFISIRVNAGGGAYTDSLGQIWSADTGYSGGTPYSVSSVILATTAPPLYRSMRSQAAGFLYQFAAPNGPYTVRLKFAELSFTSAGRRRFAVAVNGQTALSEFDIAAEAGGALVALDRSFPVNVLTGQIAIQFQPGSAGAPFVSAIEIVSGIAPAVSLSPVVAALRPSQTQQFTPIVSGTSNTAVNWTVSPPMGSVSATGLYAAPSGIPAAAQVSLIAASAADGSKSATSYISLQPTTLDGPFTPIRVNAGGPAYTDNLGQLWGADTGYSGGGVLSTWSPIAGTSSAALYQSARWQAGGLRYQFAVPNGAYTVRLKFAEIRYKNIGQRKFGVALNGQTVLTDFDIIEAGGGPLRAVDRSFGLQVTTGQIVIQFLSGSADKPQVNAIEILPGLN